MTFEAPRATHWYIDYPGIAEAQPTPIAERLFDNEAQATEVAVGIYRDSDLGKVIVCEFPSLRRVVTVTGKRSDPKVHRR
jgi:hypothetical protein